MLFLHKIVEVFTEYFKALEEESIRDNFVIIYELLDEMMDFGYPQTTESKILQEYITQESHKLEIQARPPIAVTNAVSWRSEGIRYRKNEVFLDVIESLNLLVSANGNVLRSEILGAIKMKCYLSGMPELRLGLNDKVMFETTGRTTRGKAIEMEDVKFHQCVRLLDKEKCCGVALISNGLYGQAKRQAKTNLESIRAAVGGAGRDVIATSSTCTFTLRDEYPHLLDMENGDVRDHIELATRYIYRLIGERGARLRFREDAAPLRVAYHTPCHMEKMGWAYYSIELLRMIPGVELTVLDSQCCGIAGTYGFKKENYRTSQAVGEPLFRQIEASGADVVATDCETCKWQIEMSTSKRCEHPLTILASRLA